MKYGQGVGVNAIELGPLVLAADRFAAVLGIFTFMLVAGFVANRVEGKFNLWTWVALIGGIIAARVVHVALHWQNFAAEPLRAFAIWDASFFWPAGIAAAFVSIFIVLKTLEARLWAVLPIGLGVVVWNVSGLLMAGAPIVALPESTYQTLAQTPYTLDANNGRPKVINLWATWCPPCRREMPMMADIAANTDGVDFIFANQGEGYEQVEQYLAREGIELETVLLDSTHELSRHYRMRGLPVTLFIDADGTLNRAHMGEISRETLETRIGQLQD